MLEKLMGKISIISKESEYRAALAAIEPLLQKGFENLMTAEDEELTRVSSLIENYENSKFPMPFKSMSIQNKA